jgi:hypothetical protein
MYLILVFFIFSAIHLYAGQVYSKYMYGNKVAQKQESKKDTVTQNKKPEEIMQDIVEQMKLILSRAQVIACQEEWVNQLQTYHASSLNLIEQLKTNTNTNEHAKLLTVQNNVIMSWQNYWKKELEEKIQILEKNNSDNNNKK